MFKLKSTLTMLELKRGTVRLVPHNPKWKAFFEKEKSILMEIFGYCFLSSWKNMCVTSLSNPLIPIR